MIANPEELEEERQWAIRRTLVVEKMEKLNLADDGSFYIALTPGEIERWQNYLRIRPNECCDLGTNPLERPTSSKHGRLQTLVKGSGILFFDTTSENKSRPHQGPRWLLPCEELEAMGLPVSESSQVAVHGALHT